MKNFAKIDAYLKGRLSAEERTAFEAAMKKDEELALEVAVQRFEAETIEDMVKADLRSRIRTFREESGPHPPPNGFRRYFRTWMLLPFIALLGLGVFLWLRPETPQLETFPVETSSPAPLEDTRPRADLPVEEDDLEPAAPDKPAATDQVAIQEVPQTERLFAMIEPNIKDNYYKGEIRSAEENKPVDSLLQRIQSDYINQRYARVIREAEQVAADNPYRTRLLELKGLAQLRAGDLQAAATTFSSIVEMEIEPYAERSDWHLLLSYLPQYFENNQEFKRQLEKLLNDEFHPYHQDAEALQTTLMNLAR